MTFKQLRNIVSLIIGGAIGLALAIKGAESRTLDVPIENIGYIPSETASYSADKVEHKEIIVKEIKTQPQGTDKVTEVCEEETTEAFCDWQPYDVPLSDELQETIKQSCDEYELAYELVLAVIKTESEFVEGIVGDNGKAVGLMQIHPEWWQALADENGLNIYESADNVRCGIIIIDKLLEMNDGKLDDALRMYNSGKADREYDAGYVERVFENYQKISLQQRPTVTD